MHIAAGQGQTTTGEKSWCQQKSLVTSVICYKFKKKSLWSLILYICFHEFTHVYSPGAGADNPLGTKFWCQQEHIVTSVICCKFKTNLFEVWFYTFFHDLIHVYSPRAGADSPQGTKFWCQQKGLIALPIWCKFQRNLFEVWFYTFFFHDFTHVYSPGAGADNPLGTKFWCQQEHIVTSIICCKFKTNLFEIWFYTIFFMISYMYIAPGRGAYSPQGTDFWCQQKLLVTLVICCSFQIIDDNSFWKTHCITFSHTKA